MNRNIKITIQLVLIIGSILIGYKIYRGIQDPLEFAKEKEHRNKVLQKRLINIRSAQIVYRDAKGEFCGGIDKLINFVLTDSIKVLKQFGDENDTSAVIRKEIVFVPVLEKVLVKEEGGKTLIPITIEQVEEFKYVPFTSQSQIIEMLANKIQSSGVEVPVFVARAKKGLLYNGLNSKYYNPDEYIQIGSLQEANTNGNWE